MFKKLRNLFRRKNYASPYYGKGNRPLYTSPPMIAQQQQDDKVSTPAPVHYTPTKPAEPDWEQRRFELVKMLVGQDRRSVVLGKLKATNKQIAFNCRMLADAAVRELKNHPMDESDEEGRETNDQ